MNMKVRLFSGSGLFLVWTLGQIFVASVGGTGWMESVQHTFAEFIAGEYHIRVDVEGGGIIERLNFDKHGVDDMDLRMTISDTSCPIVELTFWDNDRPHDLLYNIMVRDPATFGIAYDETGSISCPPGGANTDCVFSRSHRFTTAPKYAPQPPAPSDAIFEEGNLSLNLDASPNGVNARIQISRQSAMELDRFQS